MKKITLLVMILLFVIKSFSQTQISSEHAKEYYLQKSKSQKTIAWILLGAGTTSVVVGLIEGSEKSTGLGDIKGVAPFLIGLGADLASIPFFNSSSKNKKRAASLAISSQSIFLQQRSSLCMKSLPAITLKITL